MALLIALEGGLQIFVQIEMGKREDAPGNAAEQQSFVELFEYRDGVQAIKEAKSGTTLVNQTSIPSFLAFGNGKKLCEKIKRIEY